MKDCTYTNVKFPEISIESMKKIADRVEKIGEKTNKPSVFERIMNRFGWHRQYEIIIVDNRKLFGWLK